jgi:hypothetical protein
VGAPQRVSLLPTPISAGFVCSSLQAISAALSSECSTRYTAEMEKHTGHERRIGSTGMPFLCRKAASVTGLRCAHRRPVHSARDPHGWPRVWTVEIPSLRHDLPGSGWQVGPNINGARASLSRPNARARNKR